MATNLLKQFLGEVDRGYFVVVCLDTKNQPTAIKICHIDSLNASIVHPRDALKTAIFSDAASILVGHNHPSGKSTGIREYLGVTKRLVEAGKIKGIDTKPLIITAKNWMIHSFQRIMLKSCERIEFVIFV
jgi:DNA repair protein RadC